MVQFECPRHSNSCVSSVLSPTFPTVSCARLSVLRRLHDRARLEFRHPRRLREMQCHSAEMSAIPKVFLANIRSDSRNLTSIICFVLCTLLTTCGETDGGGLTLSDSDVRPKGEKQWENAFVERNGRPKRRFSDGEILATCSNVIGRVRPFN